MFRLHSIRVDSDYTGRGWSPAPLWINRVTHKRTDITDSLETGPQLMDRLFTVSRHAYVFNQRNQIIVKVVLLRLSCHKVKPRFNLCSGSVDITFIVSAHVGCKRNGIQTVTPSVGVVSTRTRHFFHHKFLSRRILRQDPVGKWLQYGIVILNMAPELLGEIRRYIVDQFIPLLTRLYILMHDFSAHDTRILSSHQALLPLPLEW